MTEERPARGGGTARRQELLDALGFEPVAEAETQAGLELYRARAQRLRSYLVVGAVTSFVGSAGTVVLPWLVGQAIDAAVSDQLTWHLWALLGMLVLAAATALTSQPALERFNRHLVVSLSVDMLRHGLRLGLPGRRPFEHGDLMNRASGDLWGVGRYAMARIQIAGTVLVGLGGLVAMARIDWLLAAVTVGVAPLVIALMRGLIQDFSGIMRAYRQHVSELTNRYLDADRGRKTIQASGTIDQEVARVTEPLQQVSMAGREMLEAMGRMGMYMGAAHHLLTVVMVAACGWLLSAGRITPGDVAAALAYSAFVLGSLLHGTQAGWFQIATSKVNLGRIGAVFLAPEALPEPVAPMHLGAGHRGGRGVRLEGVVVHGHDGPVLDDIDLDVPAGAMVALVGRSGAGKSHIAALVGRLHDPDQGRVCIDGTDVRQLTRTELNQLVTYAFERPAPLGATVADSISYGSESDRAAVQAAAGMAAADSFISRLPNGYDTPLSEAPMSGGERQRIGLARAALRPGSVLVLDDATSSLDMATEAQVFHSFDQLRADRTTIVVAHRASTAARADLVAWLVDGRIAALAPHAELWSEAAYQATFRPHAEDGIARG